MHIPDKQYLENVVWVGVADKITVFNVIYKKKDTSHAWSKRFIVEKFILDKVYRYFEEGAELQHLSADPSAEVEITFASSGKDKVSKTVYKLADAPIMGASKKGVRISTQKIKKIVNK